MAKSIENQSIRHDPSMEPMTHLDLNEQTPIRAIAKQVVERAEVELHHHPWGQMVFSDTGVVQVKTPQAAYLVPPQHAVWIPPGIAHAASLLERAQIFSVYMLRTNRYFHDAVWQNSWGECHCFQVSVLLHELVRRIATQTVHDLGEDNYTAICTLISTEVIQAESVPVGLPMPADKRLRHLCDLFLQAPLQSTTLPVLATQVGASESTIARLFKQELQMTFSQWRQQALLTSAIGMAAKKMAISTIAQELGYSTHSAFAAMVTSLVGKPPKAFLYR
ncbi:AraC family transcriptional regulator [Photobacterium atrarenae]|uniref:Helix-turn-helix transcriptional regulator n=1 Tax=Photobacterium atrarenae TaxID=865757 RepID=A0ABY5GNZ1_9GAMM|nr:helix-turn-helix transcriptional regulator [Photobacterium atrarenae]UTV30476.1 helix-turn-helix transcriptional regulator [Photobacterium atrarenae]